LLHQISGRAGREAHQGHVYIQTWQPEHPLMQALAHGKEQELIALEKEARSDMLMPPYGRLAAIILECPKEEVLQKSAQMLAQHIPSIEHVTILGPAPAPLYRLRNNYRMRFLIKTPRNINIQRVIHDWLHQIKLSSLVRCKIDIDPYSFL
jgi:primosomal protein N' (replication factor Y)